MSSVSHSLRLVMAFGSVLLLTGCNDPGGDPNAEIGPNPKLPDLQQYLLPPMHIAKVVSWKQGETPSVPKGMKIQAMATGLQHPRSLYVLPNGDVLVVESKAPPAASIKRPKEIIMGYIESSATSGGKTGPSNRITLLRDSNGDGVPDMQSVFLDHLNSPFGIALVGNDLYVANTNAIVKYPYQTGETKITAPGETLTPLPGGPIDHHWTKSSLPAPMARNSTFCVGSNSNITENGIEAEKNRANILEVERATGRFRIFASGLRNPNGLSFEPQSGALWAVVNGRDEIGPDLVPDYMTSVKEGAFYGWPYSYYGQHVDPRVQPQRPDLVAKAIPPDYALSSHVAPLGMTFYTGDNLPQTYRGGAFVGEHGSWNRPNLNGYKVIFIPFSDGKPNGKPQDVVTGFLNNDGQARGKPVGLAVDKTGALLVADDVGNTVWRVCGDPPTGKSASTK